MTTTEKNANAK